MTLRNIISSILTEEEVSEKDFDKAIEVFEKKFSCFKKRLDKWYRYKTQ